MLLCAENTFLSRLQFNENSTMPNGLTGNPLPEEKLPGLPQTQAPEKSPRLIRNNQKWDSLKD